MTHTNIQLTIRGLDAKTKQILVNKARQQGISLNRYALRALQESAGLASKNGRYNELRLFFNTHHIDRHDSQTLEDALDWADRMSIEKQQNEQL